MIWTEKSLEKWEKDNREGKNKIRSAIKGELPLESNTTRKLDCIGTEACKTSGEVLESNKPVIKPRFDKVAYQKNYMRKWRAKKKNENRPSNS